MSTLRISNIEAKSVPASATIDEKVKITNSSGDPLVFIDGKTSGITTVGINTTDGNITFDANSNVVVTGIITATKFVGTIEPTNLTVGGDLTIPDKIIHTGDTNTAIRFPANDTISFETSGSEKLRIQPNGRVGIGTDNPPDCTLTVCEFNSGTEIYDNIALRLQGSTGQNVAIQFTDTTGAAAYIAVQGDALRLGTNNAERLRIRSDGKVGIGTDMVGAPASNYAFGVYRASGTGYLYTEAGASSASAGLRAKAGTSDFTIFTTQGTGQLAVYDNTNSAERLRITSAGRIGINENSPDNILHIKDSNPFIELEGTTNNSGDIGIFLNANGNHWLLRADNYPSANAFTIKDGTPASSTHRLGVTAGSGNVTLYTGNLVIGTSGKGIDFSATGNAGGMTSELLDDYEEGSWTPALQFDVNGSGLSYGTRAGTYTKIGRKVTVIYYMVVSSGASSSDYFARLTLPFTGASVGHQDCRVRQWNNGYSDWFLSIGGGAPVFFHSNAAGSGTNYARGDDVNGYVLAGEFTYFI